MKVVNEINRFFLVTTFSVMGLFQSNQLLANEVELSGKVGVEQRYFLNEGQHLGQLNDSQASFFIEPELYIEWNGGADSIVFKPFYRKDEWDNERSHSDIRELSYTHAANDWEVRAGIRKEFWGVTEFQHVVDVINQTDNVEDIDGEDKLGQLMLNLSLVREWGIVDLYLLPGFRERTFVNDSSRLSGGVAVDNSDINYQSSAEDRHLDIALRWNHSVGDFDIGSYWFHGTNRDPILTPVIEDNQVIVKQYYNQMDQFGLDIQATINDWLWKFETIFRTTDEENFISAQGGLEYTYVGLLNSNTDLGLLLEYGWDSRGEGNENSLGSPVQNDIYLGSRLAFNDMQSSELLMGIGADLNHNAFSLIVEANRRLGESVKASLDVRLMQSHYKYDALYSVKEDDHIQLTLEWYY